MKEICSKGFTPERFKELNSGSFHSSSMDDSAYAFALDHIAFVARTRTPEQPQPGDIVQFIDSCNTYYHNARFDSQSGDDSWSISAHAHTPVIGRRDDGSAYVNMGGGPWYDIPESGCKLIGQRLSRFCFRGVWSALVPMTDHLMNIEAMVNVWEYTAPDLRHPPEYTTRDWMREYIYINPKKLEKPLDLFNYPISSFPNRAWSSLDEYRNWVMARRGVVFPGGENSECVFYYQEQDILLLRAAWDALDLPLDTRYCNGIIPVKVDYDDENHLIKVYRFTNGGNHTADRNYGAYELQKGRDLTPLLKLEYRSLYYCGDGRE